MVDFALSEEQRMYQQTAKDFAEKAIGPAAEAIRARDPERDSPWDIFKPVYKQAHGLGITKLLIPESYGGLGGSCLDNVIMMEEFGYADLGLAVSFLNVCITSPILIIKGGNEEQRKKWLPMMCEDDEFVLASASGEADVAGADSFCPYPDPKIGLKTSAVLQDETYTINGSKAGFATNAGAAKLYFVMARSDLSKPFMESTSLFLVPADAEGVSVGKKNELIGWKTAQHCPVYFDNVRIPAANRIGGEGENTSLFFMQAVPYLSTGLAAAYIGLARAALDCAYQYANERISWGVPIINHQAIQLKLADMVADLEAARLMVWKTAWAADQGDPQAAGILAPAAKTNAVDVAIRNAERCVKILGAYGVSEEYAAGRFLNDAWVGDAADGTRDMLRMGIVNFMRMMRGDMPGPGAAPAGGPPGAGPEPSAPRR